MNTPGSIRAGPAPVPESARLVVVFGGSFDPPHRAHVNLPFDAARSLDADWVLFVPAARSPHKSDMPSASDAMRVRMLRAGLDGRANASISTLEVDRGDVEPSFTVDTLRALRARLAGTCRMRLLIGSDQAAVFHTWREPGEIIRLAEPAVMLREPFATREALLAAMSPHWSAEDIKRWGGRLVNVPLMRAAATDVRRVLTREGPDAAEAIELLPAPVLRLIREHGLYGGGARS